MELPWVEGSEFAFHSACYWETHHKRSITLRRIEMKKGQKPLDFELVFEHRHSHHALKFAKLMRTYLDINVEYKRLTFFWLQMLKGKGVVGPENGYLSEEAYLIIMITWL
jgi:hypothetical protein